MASYSLQYYKRNRADVLEYKRQFYLNKVKKYNIFKGISIVGIKKSISNKLIKSFLNSNQLIICINDEEKTIDEFENYPKDNLKDKCLGILKSNLGIFNCEFLTNEECIQFINQSSSYQLILHFYDKKIEII